MTIITKVGVSYDDQMNDDVSEVDSFSRECYQALFSPPFLRREPGDEARGAACMFTPVLSWDGQSILGLMTWYGTTFLRISMPFDLVTGHPSLP